MAETGGFQVTFHSLIGTPFVRAVAAVFTLR